jgi:protein NRD1
MLYRTHKSLQPQFKVPSLYAFHALALAARDHATKHGFTGDAHPSNSATFLLKVEAVLEGLFQDMMSSGVSEGKVSETCTANFHLSRLGKSLVLVVSFHRT